MNISGTKKMSIRQLFAPALLAAAFASITLTAQADSHGDHEASGADRQRMEERMEERRQEVYQHAEISADKQAELNEAHAEHREAMHALREEHKERVAGILTEAEQEALHSAMREAHEEHRGKRGHHENNDERVDSE